MRGVHWPWPCAHAQQRAPACQIGKGCGPSPHIAAAARGRHRGCSHGLHSLPLPTLPLPPQCVRGQCCAQMRTCRRRQECWAACCLHAGPSPSTSPHASLSPRCLQIINDLLAPGHSNLKLLEDYTRGLVSPAARVLLRVCVCAWLVRALACRSRGGIEMRWCQCSFPPFDGHKGTRQSVGPPGHEGRPNPAVESGWWSGAVE